MLLYPQSHMVKQLVSKHACDACAHFDLTESTTKTMFTMQQGHHKRRAKRPSPATHWESGNMLELPSWVWINCPATTYEPLSQWISNMRSSLANDEEPLR